MGRALPGGHYCATHQGNHSHYDESNCELCRAYRERDEARAIANDRDAMVDHRDRALTAMYQRVDVITRERDEARARVLADVVEILSAQHTWLTRVAAINLVAGLYGQAAEVFAAADEALAATEPRP